MPVLFAPTGHKNKVVKISPLVTEGSIFAETLLKNTRMKVLFYTLALLSLSIHFAHAQAFAIEDTWPERGSSIKLYTSSFIINSDRHSALLDPEEASLLDFGGFSLAGQWVMESFVHELEASYWQWEHESADYEKTYEEYTLRYELGTYLRKPLANNLWLRLGGGALFFRGQENELPKSPFDFPRVRNTGGVAVTFIPHLEWALGERWYLDLNVSFISFTFSLNEVEAFRPDLPVNLSNFSNYSFIAGGVRQLRFGVGYRL
jgi:hypothetical protein